MSKADPMLAGALEIAAVGWRVLPCKGKRPFIKDWPQLATTSPEIIREWWGRHPGVNLGIAHGPGSNTLALDVDGADGEQSIRDLESRLGALPEGAEVETAKGRHLIYRHPAARIRNAVRIAPGLDVRAAGGMTVAPPSIHPDTGDSYSWLVHPAELDSLAELPAPWVEYLQRAEQSPSAPPKAADGNLPQGQRNSGLASLAGSMRRRGMSEQAILAALMAENAERCRPPLEEREVRAIAASIARYEPHGERASTWTPFPVECLPTSLRRLVVEGAKAIRCDPSYIALAVLGACAAAIGLSRSVQIKRGWAEPIILWLLIVGRSGTRKDPALDIALAPLRELDAASRRAHRRAMVRYEAKILEHQCALRDFKRGDISEAPKAPRKPKRKRVLTEDATVEALARLIVENPRSSIAVVRREMSAWFKGWGEYKANSGGDAERWLELHGGRFPSVDRVTAGELHTEACAVSVIGGTQPKILRRVLRSEYRESGCAARLLFCHPPPVRGGWTDAEIPAAVVSRYSEIIAQLHAMVPMAVFHRDIDEVDGLTVEESLAPRPIPLSDRARETFARYADSLAGAILEAGDDEAAALSKLEGGAARLACLLELVAGAEANAADKVEGITSRAMANGIVLAHWFAGESGRVEAILSEDGVDAELRELAELIASRGGTLSVRDLREARRRYRGAGSAEEALDRLVKSGRAEWTQHKSGARGGRGNRAVTLSPDGPAPTEASSAPAGEVHGAGDAWGAGTPAAEHTTSSKTHG